MVKSALAHFDDHFSPYLRCFQRQTRSVEDAAKRYLHGLFQCDRRNMEQMAEQVAGIHENGRSIDFQLDDKNEVARRSDLKYANVASRLQADEKALQEWHSKIAEIRKNQA